MNDALLFRPCSTCKKPIALGARYWVCNVSTCNARSNAFVFCSVDCWDAHVPTMRHKDSWAEERTAPTSRPAAPPAAAAPTPPNAAPRRLDMSTPSAGSVAAVSGGEASTDDILIVASKLKAYVRARSEMNTSADVMERLSDIVRRLCEDAIEHARDDGRKTVMARDFVRS